ncbi:MAG: hypothetical protein A2Z14_04975 [Chloroflexi bacterium RBG_16_48_8]|nr:MAG: hypothetical protein A2Z14_04975 [Chloroflexi bacterium RBG_16_48_8]
MEISFASLYIYSLLDLQMINEIVPSLSTRPAMIAWMIYPIVVCMRFSFHVSHFRAYTWKGSMDVIEVSSSILSGSDFRDRTMDKANFPDKV